MATLKKTYQAEVEALRNAVHRCTSKTNAQYFDYGGRGISIHESFLGPQGFINFLAAVGPKPSPELTLDRVDNSKGYEPGNLAWTSRTVQQRNRRDRREPKNDFGWGSTRYEIVRRDGVVTNRLSPLIPAHGKTQSLKEWSDELGISQRCIRQRLQRGATPEQALVPVLFSPWGKPRNDTPTIH